MHSRRIPVLVVTFVALAGGTVPINAGQGATDVEWRRIQEGGVVIEYQDDMEALARQVLPEAAKHLKEAQSAAVRESGALSQTRDAALQLISDQLGLQQPNARMGKEFDEITSHFAAVLRAGTNVQLFRLCRVATLKSLLVSGAEFPGFTYDATTDTLTFDFGFQSGFSTPGHSNGVRGRSAFEYPLVVDEDDPAEPIDQVTDLLNVLDELPRMWGCSSAGMVYHMLAKSAMISDLRMQSAFRRWFCEGTANYIAARCLEAVSGESAAQMFMEFVRGGGSQTLKAEVDLLTWRAEDWDAESPTPIAGDLLKAYCAFATQEIFELVDRHGPDVIPAIFAQIAKSGDPDEQKILDAIQNVTGEDFRAVLSEYGTSAAGHFEGLAVRNLATGVYELDDQGQWNLKEEATTIPIVPDERHGVCVQGLFAVLSPPATVRAELVRPDAPTTASSLRTLQCQLTGKLLMLTLGWCLEGDFQAGAYVIKIYFNDQFYRDLPIIIVPISPLVSEFAGVEMGKSGPSSVAVTTHESQR